MNVRAACLLLVSVVTVPACRDGAGAGADGADGAAAPSEAEGGTISGRVLGHDGAPIRAPGAQVMVFVNGVSEKSGERVQYSPAVKPDGTYRQKLTDGSYHPSTARVKVEFDGQNWIFDLEPTPEQVGGRSSDEGIVQDFVWKLTGKRPGKDGDVNNHTHWWGGSVSLHHDMYREDLKAAVPAPPDGTKFTFQLTPEGTLIDGSPAKPLTIERTWSAARGELDDLNDLPIARYTLTGSAALPDGGTRPVLFRVEFKTYAASLPLRFHAATVGGPIVSFLLGP